MNYQTYYKSPIFAKSDTVDEISLEPATMITQFSFCEGELETLAASLSSCKPFYE